LSFIIIAVYVDDLNIIVSPEEIKKIVKLLKNEFKMKDLGVTNLCLGLQIEHFHNDIFVHQSNYIQNMLKRFNMDKTHSPITPMIVRSLDVNKDPYRHRENNEKALGPEVPYLSAIGVLMYLANNTRPDIAFSVNVLVRYSSDPTHRHWNIIKHVLCYLCGTRDMKLFYRKYTKSKIVGYADAIC
jgi:Reverse transcriptase (RNA-dependent DNA polymerase)